MRDERVPRHHLLHLALGSAAVVSALVLYASSWHTAFGKNSDHANAVLAGHDLVNGNPLLGDWVLPLNSYWSVDLPFFGVFAALAGVRSVAMNVVPVFIATAVLLFGAWIASQAAVSVRGRLVGVGVVALLLGLPHPLLGNFFLQGPEHIATTLYCLVAFVLLAGTRIGSIRWILGVGVMGAAVLGDALALAIGVVPVMAAGAMASFRQKRWAPLVAPAAAAIASAGGAALVRLVLDHVHAFTFAPALPLSPPGNRFDNLIAIRRLIPSLLGFGDESGLTGFFRLVHLVGLSLFAAGVIASIFVTVERLLRRGRERHRDVLFTRSAWFDDVLVVGALAGFCSYVFIALPPSDVHTSRYLLPALIYGVVLTARRSCALVERLPERSSRGLIALLIIVFCLYAGASVDVLRGPSGPPPAQELAEWLTENHLTSGFGAYWAASIVTVASDEAVTVRPVRAVQGRLHGLLYYSSKAWFEPGDSPRRFLVHQPGLPVGEVDDDTAIATFGPFERAVDLGPYRILIWDRDISSALGSPRRDR